MDPRPAGGTSDVMAGDIAIMTGVGDVMAGGGNMSGGIDIMAGGSDVVSAPDWAILLTAILALVIALVGFFGNGLTVLALPSARRRNSSSNITTNTTTWFVVNLAVAEGLFCLTILPVNSVHLFHLYTTARPLLGHGACAFYAFCRFSLQMVGLFSIAAIAINRCVLICVPGLYTKVFTSLNTGLIIAGLWLVSFLALLPTLIKVYGKFGYNIMTNECDFLSDKEYGMAPQILLMCIGYFIPCIIIITSYVVIFCKARSSSTKMVVRTQASLHNTQRKSGLPAPSVSYTKRDIRIAKTIGAIFIAFLVCCTPVAVVHYICNTNPMPTLLLLLHPLYWVQFCINMFIYVIMNSQYRDAYVQYVAKWWPDIKQISRRMFKDDPNSEYVNDTPSRMSNILQNYRLSKNLPDQMVTAETDPSMTSTDSAV